MGSVTAMIGVPPSSKEQIVLAAERLFAERGIHGVSLRQISAAAGNGNTAAVQYHFGSKDALVQAIFEYRLPRLTSRRDYLLSSLTAISLRTLVECQIHACLEQSEVADSNYMSFVAMLAHNAQPEWFEKMPEHVIISQDNFHDRLRSCLDHLPEPLQTLRISEAMTLIVHVASDRERAHLRGQPTLPLLVVVADLVDGMAGFLEAPASAASLEVLAGASPAQTNLSLLP
jgi:AcrR family transcriptional regulator